MSDIIQQLNECAKVCQEQRMVGDAYVMREAAAEITRLRAKVEAADKLAEALARIIEWSNAYPTEVFPEPDFARAAAALSAAGMSLDAVSASNMRHATKGVGKIATAALTAYRETEE